MGKLKTRAEKLATILAWLATVAPSWWFTMLTTISATCFSLWAFGLKILARPDVHGGILVFMGIFWTYVGLIVIRDRRRPVETYPLKDFRYGLTFEGLSASFDPRHDVAALQFNLTLRNFSPAPIRYSIEKLIVKVDSRHISNENSPPNFLTRGAAKTFMSTPFKLAHIKEFFGLRPEGTAEVSVVYGDIDGEPTRRLSMSFRLFFSFPPCIEEGGVTILQQNMTSVFGLSSAIQNESDVSI